MTILEQAALRANILDKSRVERLYENSRQLGLMTVIDVEVLCESHERLRAEMEGMQVLLAEAGAALKEVGTAMATPSLVENDNQPGETK